MIEKEVIIIGGGPAGSACTLKLKESGISALILDKSKFPRVKLCAGWITPRVFSLLGMKDYPYGIIQFDTMHLHYYTSTNKEIKFSAKTKQYSIRRYEFDHWLLQKSGAEIIQHKVQHIRQDENGYYIIDNQYKAKFLVGAGGTHCPVYREIFRNKNPRNKEYQIGALEIEFPYDYQDSDCYLWFCENGLPGYSWYVPKENGYLNIGLGAFSHHLNGKSLQWHFDYFIQKLEKKGLVKNFQLEPKGHTYFLRDVAKVLTDKNSCIIGDSAGLATKDMGEGIGPAIESGFQAAEWIAKKNDFNFHHIPEYSIIEFGIKGRIIYHILKIIHLLRNAKS